MIPPIREAGVLADEELVATFRPAMGPVQHVVGLAEDDGLRVACALTVERAAREAPAGFWPAVLRRLLSFKGTLPELLAHPD
ncbi:hypothetical protein [Nonomuraea sp. SYSU D8015]|uniref:hypothetical protein n=1 Tax=Nonomuraea sp. SYSU D8015 TaxID=2593644 RepID=UPI0016602BE6|nr:hypothetical protein [Nonomuraea sp. SYSU D8015]